MAMAILMVLVSSWSISVPVYVSVELCSDQSRGIKRRAHWRPWKQGVYFRSHDGSIEDQLKLSARLGRAIASILKGNVSFAVKKRDD